MERKVPAHQLVVREVTPDGRVGLRDFYKHLHFLFWEVEWRQFLLWKFYGRFVLLLREVLRVSAVSRTVTTVSKF